MQRDKKPESEIWGFLDEAEQRAADKVTVEPVFDTKGNQIGTVIKGQGAKVLAQPTAKLSDADRLRVQAAQKRLNTIENTLTDPEKSVLIENKSELEAERTRLKQEIDTLLGPPQTTEPQTAENKEAGARVRVKSPDGKIGSIPQSQLDAALKAGFIEVK
jgi:hypothetical protein